MLGPTLAAVAFFLHWRLEGGRLKDPARSVSFL